ncbi:Rep protein [Salmonella sp. 3DZ2-4SM]|nr:Rep protein [Salmonella sp. 3DZ2-4SM]HDX8233842.1 Rep protein [Staphylococcus aureus]HDX8234331.1 Rep protein [Staphylococcus aureus]
MVYLLKVTLQQNQIFYIWKQKEYLASELYDLTEQEKREINYKMIDEIEEEQ